MSCAGADREISVAAAAVSMTPTGVSHFSIDRTGEITSMLHFSINAGVHVGHVLEVITGSSSLPGPSGRPYTLKN